MMSQNALRLNTEEFLKNHIYRSPLSIDQKIKEIVDNSFDATASNIGFIYKNETNQLIVVNNGIPCENLNDFNLLANTNSDSNCTGRFGLGFAYAYFCHPHEQVTIMSNKNIIQFDITSFTSRQYSNDSDDDMFLSELKNCFGFDPNFVVVIDNPDHQMIRYLDCIFKIGNNLPRHVDSMKNIAFTMNFINKNLDFFYINDNNDKTPKKLITFNSYFNNNQLYLKKDIIFKSKNQFYLICNTDNSIYTVDVNNKIKKIPFADNDEKDNYINKNITTENFELLHSIPTNIDKAFKNRDFINQKSNESFPSEKTQYEITFDIPCKDIGYDNPGTDLVKSKYSLLSAYPLYRNGSLIRYCYSQKAERTSTLNTAKNIISRTNIITTNNTDDLFNYNANKHSPNNELPSEIYTLIKKARDVYQNRYVFDNDTYKETTLQQNSENVSQKEDNDDSTNDSNIKNDEKKNIEVAGCAVKSAKKHVRGDLKLEWLRQELEKKAQEEGGLLHFILSNKDVSRKIINELVQDRNCWNEYKNF